MSQLQLSWSDLDSAIPQMLSDIRRWAKESGTDLKGVYVYAPPRGALPLGVAVSHEFGMELIQNLSQVRVLKGTKTIIFVDDIVDSGKELAKFRNFCPESPAFSWMMRFPVASVVKPPVYFVTSVESGKWVIFPWERQDKWETERSEYESSRK